MVLYEQSLERIELDGKVILNLVSYLDHDNEFFDLGLIDGITGSILWNKIIQVNTKFNSNLTDKKIGRDSSLNFQFLFDIDRELIKSFQDKQIVLYNLELFKKLLSRMVNDYSCDEKILEYFLNLNFKCAMSWYAEFWNDWDENDGNYIVQELTTAAQQQGVDISDLEVNKAIDVCEIIRRVIIAVNEQLEEQQEQPQSECGHYNFLEFEKASNDLALLLNAGLIDDENNS